MGNYTDVIPHGVPSSPGNPALLSFGQRAKRQRARLHEEAVRERQTAAPSRFPLDGYMVSRYILALPRFETDQPGASADTSRDQADLRPSTHDTL